MRRLIIPALIPLLCLANAPLASSPDLGKAEGRCRISETGPALLVSPVGLRDRKGLLKLEVYPANDEDFLADDNVLLATGKTFRRVELPLPATGPIELCIRLPASGTYAVSLLHDRDGDRKFSLTRDGVGFAGNPRLGMNKPRSITASVTAGSSLTHLSILMNYRRGLLSFGPLER